MFGRLGLVLLFTIGTNAQDETATALLQKAEAMARSTTSWRAEVIEASQFSGHGMSMRNEIHIKVAAQVPLKMRRENSGSDRTMLICDGTESFYSGDGHSYYRGPAGANPDCNFPLSSFYKLADSPRSASIVGHDHITLADGDHACDVVRAEWQRTTAQVTRTMCIEPTSGLILRDVKEGESSGLRTVVTTTFVSYEGKPSFASDAFKFSIPPGSLEAKPPI
jgi:outer membrane lipoprotein-sorting protein